MGYLKALGMGITINIHDASGVNSWEAMFPALVDALGLPANTTKVPFNLVNASVAYAVEDLVLGDLVNNKFVDFMWIDWQQGGDAGGMTGYKQNPTFWLNHLRCTDRHRVGDSKRALVLARWGGLGMHRYQVGFSGDVAGLTWSNMLYQPYFSATSANVGHGFWSHDIEGPPEDQEMYTRWIQIGSFSGVMRSHDRGMSAGGCNNKPAPAGTVWEAGCSTVEPWNVPNVHFEANRAALQLREELVPYIYTAHRAAFDSGVGLIIPMYYNWPESDSAYLMDGVRSDMVQYMFGPSILFSPVTSPAQPYAFGPGLASKSTWLPEGAWYDSTTGALISVPAGAAGSMHAGTYTLAQVPLFLAAGAVVPYLPLRSLPVLGLASQQYSFLGFKIAPGGSGSGSTTVYEDDGVTTSYLTANASAWTTAAYTRSAGSVTVSISTSGSFPELPSSRSYQLRLLNAGTLASVTVNGASVPYNRFGIVASAGRVPAASQWYWEFAVNQGGMGPVVDIVGASTGSVTTVVLTFAAPLSSDAAMSGVYGIVSRAVLGKTNLDLDRSTPASNSPGPAYLTKLASVGEALTHYAGTNATMFAQTLAGVPGLLANAIQDVAGDSKSPRQNFTEALLQGSW
jgi:alpha-glucosidase